MVPPARLELAASCSEDKRSNPLSYGGLTHYSIEDSPVIRL